MHHAVRTFRASFVEGRVVPLLGVLLCVAARVALFLWGQPFTAGIPSHDYLWTPLLRWVNTPVLSFIASTASVFLAAGLLSLLNSRFNLIRIRSNLPLVAPLFLFSLHPYFLVMTGDWVALLFVLAAFFPLLESYQRSDSYLYSFRAAILIGIASLFQVFALLLLPLWWWGERTMRGGQSRSFVSSLFGVLLIYISLFSVYFLRNDVAGFLEPLRGFTAFSLDKLPPFDWVDWLGVFLILLFFIISIVMAARIYSRDKVLTLTFNRFTVFLITVVVFLQGLYWEQTHFFLLFSIALIAHLNAYLFSRTQNKGNILWAYSSSALMILFYLSHFYQDYGLPL